MAKHYSYGEFWRFFIKRCWRIPKFYFALLLFCGPGFIGLANSEWHWAVAVGYIVMMFFFVITATSFIAWSDQRQREDQEARNGQPKQSQ